MSTYIRKPSSFLDPSLVKEFSGEHMKDFELQAIFCKNPRREPYKISWTNDPRVRAFIWTDNDPTNCTFRIDNYDPFHYAMAAREDFDWSDFCQQILPDKYGHYYVPQMADCLVGIKTPNDQEYSLCTQYGNPPLDMGTFPTILKNPMPIGEPGLCPLEVKFSGQESKLPIVARIRYYNNDLRKKIENDRVYFYNKAFERFAVYQGRYIREYDE